MEERCRNEARRQAYIEKNANTKTHARTILVELWITMVIGMELEWLAEDSDECR